VSRIAEPKAGKFADRRSQLAASALHTLAELGYARTSLREIAQNSEFSHGVLHYYFRDKVELITCCVRLYKESCVARYDRAVTTARTAVELRADLGESMATTLRQDTSMHRLWFDLRNQSLFEESFRADVREIDASLERMIGRIVERYAELAGATPAVPDRVAYALLYGLFHQALLSHLAGDEGAAPRLREDVGQVLERLVR
jgi:AcrR family transcriptional regulator